MTDENSMQMARVVTAAKVMSAQVVMKGVVVVVGVAAELSGSAGEIRCLWSLPPPSLRHDIVGLHHRSA